MSDALKPLPDTVSLEKNVRATSKKGDPPVHLWNPPFYGDIDMRIARDGTWFYQGTPINRPELVRLFSSILKMEEGEYFLVTPVEKVGLLVDDAPFVAIDFDQEGDTLVFETNVGDRVSAGAKNAIRVAENPETGEPAPYIHVRRGLEALIDRKSFYRLVELGEMQGDHTIVNSAGEQFIIGPAI